MRFTITPRMDELIANFKGWFVDNPDSRDVIMKPDTPANVVLDYLEFRKIVDGFYEYEECHRSKVKLYVGDRYIADI
jgi:hypothetical protein